MIKIVFGKLPSGCVGCSRGCGESRSGARTSNWVVVVAKPGKGAVAGALGAGRGPVLGLWNSCRA